MNVTVTLEYTDPLSLNLTEQITNPLSFSISDGINTIDKTTASSWRVNVGTDENGLIDSWFVFAVTGAGDSQWYIETINSNLTTLVWDYGRIGAGLTSNHDIASIRDAPGVWAVSPVPIPAAAWLFVTALIGLVGFGKRRKAAWPSANN